MRPETVWLLIFWLLSGYEKNPAIKSNRC